MPIPSKLNIGAAGCDRSNARGPNVRLPAVLCDKLVRFGRPTVPSECRIKRGWLRARPRPALGLAW